MANPTAITKRDLAELMKLLGYLQDRLESEIDCYAIPGTMRGVEPADTKIVRAAQSKWRRAEKMVKKLEAMHAGA